MGSIGICGRGLCCSQFLDEFMPVSIKMAKEQGLSLNPAKISGACGRLMCCLKYEQEMYEELNRELPSSGTEVMTPDGIGTVVSVALLKGIVRVKFREGEETTLKDYSADDIEVKNQSADTNEASTEALSDDEHAKKHGNRANRNRYPRKKTKTTAHEVEE